MIFRISQTQDIKKEIVLVQFIIVTFSYLCLTCNLIPNRAWHIKIIFCSNFFTCVWLLERHMKDATECICDECDLIIGPSEVAVLPKWHCRWAARQT